VRAAAEVRQALAGLDGALDRVDLAAVRERVEVLGDGVLVEREGRWLWRVHHGSEPGRW
jgi:hypothetical protein